MITLVYVSTPRHLTTILLLPVSGNPVTGLRDSHLEKALTALTFNGVINVKLHKITQKQNAGPKWL